MKSFAPIILIMILTSQTSKEPSYGELVRKADLIVAAWMETADLEAEGEKILWTVTYKVNRILKGSLSEDKLTLKFDSSVFTHRNRASTGPDPGHSMVILFLKTGESGSNYKYVGPLLNSPLIIASEDNLTAVEKTLKKPEKTFTDWLEANKTGVILIGAFALLAVILVIVLLNKPGRTSES